MININTPTEFETRDILDAEDNVVGQLTLPEGTSEDIWTEHMSRYLNTIPAPTIQDIVKQKILDAQIFGNKLIEDFTAENVLMGITQAGKTVAVTNYLHKLTHYIMTGSLYAAIDEMNIIIADENKGDLSPFVTNERIAGYKNKVQKFLGLPQDE